MKNIRKYIYFTHSPAHTKNLSNFQLDKCRVGHPIPADFLSKVCISRSGNKYVMSFCKNIKKCVRAKKKLILCQTILTWLASLKSNKQGMEEMKVRIEWGSKHKKAICFSEEMHNKFVWKVANMRLFFFYHFNWLERGKRRITLIIQFIFLVINVSLL